MEDFTILKREEETSASLFLLPVLIYQMHALKTKKMNSLGWHKSYTVYITATEKCKFHRGKNLVCTQNKSQYLFRSASTT